MQPSDKAEGVVLVRYDVLSHRPADRFDYWREVICREFTALTPSAGPTAEASFAGSVVVRPLSTLNRSVLSSVEQRVAHGPREVAAVGEGVYFVNLQLAGRCHVRTEGGSSDVMPGQLTVVDTTTPYWFDYDGPWRVMSFQVPHTGVTVADPAESIGKPIDAGSGVGLVVASLMRSLWDIDTGGSSPHLLENALQQCFWSSAEAVLGGSWHEVPCVQSTLRGAAVQYIRANLGDASLCANSVAAVLAVSVRALHYAFSNGESFASFVRRERLDAVARELRNPANVESVSRIAVRFGLCDASSFSRAFRREFSISARDYRAQFAQHGAQSVETRPTSIDEICR